MPEAQNFWSMFYWFPYGTPTTPHCIPRSASSSLADTEYKGFSGAAAKNKGDDNDTSNGLVNGQALLNLDSLERTYGTLDFDEIFRLVIKN